MWFYCFSEQQACETVANKFLVRPQSFELELTHCGDVNVVQTLSIFCQKLGHLAASSGAVWVPSCLFHASTQKPQNSILPSSCASFNPDFEVEKKLIAE